VGIPGRVVRSSPVGHLNPSGVDLNHHLIPDPVADALSCLLERVRVLEAQLAQSRTDGEEAHCADCDSSPLCGPESSLTPQARRKGVAP